LGFVLFLPIPIPVLILQNHGVTSNLVLWPAFAFGVVVEFAVAYLFALLSADFVLKRLQGLKGNPNEV